MYFNIGTDEDEGVENEILYRSQPMSDRLSRPTSSQNTPKREPNAGKHMIRSSSVESGSFNYGRPSSDPSISMMETIHGGGNRYKNTLLFRNYREIRILCSGGGCLSAPAPFLCTYITRLLTMYYFSSFLTVIT